MGRDNNFVTRKGLDYLKNRIYKKVLVTLQNETIVGKVVAVMMVFLI